MVPARFDVVGVFLARAGDEGVSLFRGNLPKGSDQGICVG
jgi:hypothetical protein